MTNKFKFENIDDFDRHIDLSIPNYQTLNSIFTSITKEFAQPDSTVIDLHTKDLNLYKGIVQNG